MPYGQYRRGSYSRRRRAYSRARNAFTRKRKRTGNQMVRYKRRYDRNNLRSAIRADTSLGGFPSQQPFHQRFAYEFTMDAAIEAYAQKTFKANGMYQPVDSGATHQPYGFDQFIGSTAPYNKFTVTKSTISVTNINQTFANATPPAYLGIARSDSNTITFDNCNHFLESPQIGLDVKLAEGQYNTSTAQVTVTKTFDAQREFGKRFITGDSAFTGSATADPTEMTYFVVVNYAVHGGDPAEQSYFAIIDYYGVFTDPRLLTQS